jgi:hypothetical protein
MAEPCLLDNDIVLKGAAYGLGAQITELFTLSGRAPAILGVARFVIPKIAAKGRNCRNPQAMTTRVQAVMDQLQIVEPSETEIRIAAELETRALKSGGALDTGEAQLLAVLLSRSSPAIVTGDKRAIAAIARLEETGTIDQIVCLEQVFAQLISIEPVQLVRDGVCNEPSIDRTMTICFACASASAIELHGRDVAGALRSYVDHLRLTVGAVLMSDEKVSTLTSKKDGEGLT